MKRTPRRFGVTEKLWLSMVALVIVVMVPVGVALDRGLGAYYFRQNTAELVEIGNRFAEFLARAPGREAGAAVSAIAEITGTPLLVIDEQGVVTAGSAELAGEVGQRLQNPRILGALRGEPSVFLAADQSIPGSLFVTAVPIRLGGSVTGAVVLFRPAGTVEGAMRSVRGLIAAAAALLLLFLTAVAWLLSRRLARPLLTMKEAAHAMAAGDYHTAVQVRGRDELKELAEAINHLGASLHALETGRRAFFANVSHELRTPLSYVQGYADALSEGLATSADDVKAYGRILSEEARRLSRLVDDLFELARAEEGSLSLRPRPMPLHETVVGVIDRVSSRAAEKSIELRHETPPDTAVYADPERVAQILINLLDNAIRHTPKGGQIRIAATAEPAATVSGDALHGSTLSAVPHGQVRISVEDSGPGFPTEGEGDLSMLFDRFYRGEKSRNSHLGGAGLGLPIVKSLVTASGGSVWAGRSEVLGGAAIHFTLPDAQLVRPSDRLQAEGV